MRRTVLVHGLVAGALIAALRVLEYRFLVVEHAFQIYGGLVALLFAALGVWLGLRLRGGPERVAVRVAVRVAQRAAEVPPASPPASEPPAPEPPASEPPGPDAARPERFGITRREHEILALIAAGLSNREIAERLSVSENTVKTHASRVLGKLRARRRTQAVQLAKEAGLLP